MVKLLLLISISSLLFSCWGDRVIGVERTVVPQKTPSESCMKSALKEVEEIESFDKSYVQPHTEWSCYQGFIHPPSFDLYKCKTSYGNSYIYVYNNYNNSPKIKLISGKIGTAMDVSEIKFRRRLLSTIYNKMREKCEGLPKPDKVKERCINLSCK